MTRLIKLEIKFYEVKTVIFLFFLLLFQVSFSYIITLDNISENIVYQDDSVINKDELESIKDNYDYSIEETQTNWWTDFKEWLAIQWEKLFGEPFDPNSFWAKLFDILPYIILAIALVLLVWFIARNNPGNQIMRQHQNSKLF